MERKKIINETSLRPFLAYKKLKSKVSKKKIKHIKNIYLTKTFASKLFIKLCRDVIDPIIICLQTLKYEPENRKQEEIESTIPFLTTLENFNYFVNFLESPKSGIDLMTRFAKITFYQYHRKNSIIKRAGDSNETFYILLKGNIFKYNLIFEIENLTLEHYLLYLVLLELINENEIIKKCLSLNKDLINIDIEIDDSFSVEKFVKRINKFDYHELQINAQKELTNLGFNSNLFKKGKLKRVPNKENFFKIFDNLGKISNTEGKNKFQFYIGKYKFCSNLIQGQFFNNISENNMKENNLYLCETNCDLGEIKREEFIKTELNKSINQKMRKLFSNVKNNFFVLRGIDDKIFLDNYSSFFLYKKFKKHDIIFSQGANFNGMYLVLEGNISITSSSGIDKLCNLLFSIVNSIKSFSEYIPSFNPDNIIKDFNNMHQLLYKSIKMTHEEYLSKRTIDISIQKNFEILGFYELIDNKTDLYNFKAECISEDAILLFIPRNNLNLVLGKELNFYKCLISLVENKIQYIVGRFKFFIHKMMANYKMSVQKSNSISKLKTAKNKNNKLDMNNINLSNKRNYFNQSSKKLLLNNNKRLSIVNENEKKGDGDIICNYNLKSYNYHESLVNFENELKRKKKIEEEIMMNKRNNLIIQNSLNKLNTPKKLKLNPLDLNLAGNNFYVTFRNNFLPKNKRSNTHKSINLSNHIKNQFNNYFSINTIKDNYNYDNDNFYEEKIRKYHAFPSIKYKRNEFIYK